VFVSGKCDEIGLRVTTIFARARRCGKKGKACTTRLSSKRFFKRADLIQRHCRWTPRLVAP
jgi:hypothetical protein